VASLAVIEYLDVPEGVLMGFFPCYVFLIVKYLAFKTDLREWDPANKKMGKCITLTVNELIKW